MKSILDKIVENKLREVGSRIRQLGCGMPNPPAYKPVSMSRSLLERAPGIVAEFKRRSPSKGEIHPLALPGDVVRSYDRAGAVACSVLTDTVYFGGSLYDLSVARESTSLPLLRKDFIVTPYQIEEARVYGADAILLIAAILTRQEIEAYTRLAHGLGMEVLFEIHNALELDKFSDGIDMVGVNNRDLTTFATDPSLSLEVARSLPSEVVKVAESGLTSVEEVKRLADAGYSGFLIGETFMRHSDPGVALGRFINGTL